jgi:hypothetical protein
MVLRALYPTRYSNADRAFQIVQMSGMDIYNTIWEQSCIVSSGVVVVEGPFKQSTVDALLGLENEIKWKVREMPKACEDGGFDQGHESGARWPARQ